MKYRRAYLANPNFRFGIEPIQRIANEIVYVCPAPMFDDISGIDQAPHFEGSIVRSLAGFNPEKDILVFFGDAIIFGMMIYYLADKHDRLMVARYSSKRDEYIVRPYEAAIFEEFEEENVDA